MLFPAPPQHLNHTTWPGGMREAAEINVASRTEQIRIGADCLVQTKCSSTLDEQKNKVDCVNQLACQSGDQMLAR